MIAPGGHGKYKHRTGPRRVRLLESEKAPDIAMVETFGVVGPNGRPGCWYCGGPTLDGAPWCCQTHAFAGRLMIHQTPDPKTIAERAAEIRSGWTEADFRSHAASTPELGGRFWIPPAAEVVVPHIGFCNEAFTPLPSPKILPYFEPGKADEPDD